MARTHEAQGFGPRSLEDCEEHEVRRRREEPPQRQVFACFVLRDLRLLCDFVIQGFRACAICRPVLIPQQMIVMLDTPTGMADV